jgi:hypothetical protein
MENITENIMESTTENITEIKKCFYVSVLVKQGKRGGNVYFSYKIINANIGGICRGN